MTALEQLGGFVATHQPDDKVRAAARLHAADAIGAWIAACGTAEGRALFMPEGRVPRAGDVIRDPAQADALERLGAEGGAPFYEGDIGAAISARVPSFSAPLLRTDTLASQRNEPSCMLPSQISR